MNRSLLPRGGVLLAAAAALVGCGDGLTDINRNPNEPVSVGAEFLFPNAVEAGVSRALGAGLHMDLTALWVQHYAESRYSAEDRYEITDAMVSGHWTGFYAGPLQDFTEVVQQGEAAGRPNVAAPGRIMRAWTFHVVTDLWGDVGYSGALRGREASAPLVVELDPQAQVYAALQSELTAAAAALQPGGVGLGSADLIYRGDAAKWRRFASSLRLRLAMRTGSRDEPAARAAFASALQAGVLGSNADNAVLRYVDNGVDVHPIFAYERGRDDHAVSATLVDTLKGLSDPRLAVFARTNKGGNYRGVQNGSLESVSLDSVSRIGSYFASPASTSVLMSYAEVLFLQAEAAARGWIAGDAGSLYRQAITAHMQQIGIGQPAITAYLAQPRVAYAAGPAGLRQIALQKWIALYGNGPEAYAEWRRTGVPELRAGPDAANDGRIPRRLPYPAVEESLNGANLEAAIARQGGAGLNDRVWWNRS